MCVHVVRLCGWLPRRELRHSGEDAEGQEGELFAHPLCVCECTKCPVKKQDMAIPFNATSSSALQPLRWSSSVRGRRHFVVGKQRDLHPPLLHPEDDAFEVGALGVGP